MLDVVGSLLGLRGASRPSLVVFRLPGWRVGDRVLGDLMPGMPRNAAVISAQLAQTISSPK
jgi:hypothetical protein